MRDCCCPPGHASRCVSAGNKGARFDIVIQLCLTVSTPCTAGVAVLLSFAVVVARRFRGCGPGTSAMLPSRVPFLHVHRRLYHVRLLVGRCVRVLSAVRPGSSAVLPFAPLRSVLSAGLFDVSAACSSAAPPLPPLPPPVVRSVPFGSPTLGHVCATGVEGHPTPSATSPPPHSRARTTPQRARLIPPGTCYPSRPPPSPPPPPPFYVTGCCCDVPCMRLGPVICVYEIQAVLSVTDCSASVCKNEAARRSKL